MQLAINIYAPPPRTSVRSINAVYKDMSSAQQQRITEAEQRKYWDIFTALNPINGYLNGFQAKSVLENSQLDNAQLEQIWDLADVDNGALSSEYANE